MLIDARYMNEVDDMRSLNVRWMAVRETSQRVR